MSTELTMLLWTSVLTILLAFPYTVGLIGQLGLPRMAGNRDDLPASDGWIGRGKRAHANMVENIAPFAALILITEISGAGNATTALGAQMFFWGRVAHAIIYYAGIPYARTAAFFLAAIGEVLILVQLL